MNFDGMYAASKIGATTKISFSSGASNTTQLSTSPFRPTLYVLRSTVSVYLRQGGSGITAAATDILLRPGTYWPVVVENPSDAYLATNGAGSAGTLYCTVASRIGA